MILLLGASDDRLDGVGGGGRVAPDLTLEKAHDVPSHAAQGGVDLARRAPRCGGSWRPRIRDSVVAELRLGDENPRSRQPWPMPQFPAACAKNSGLDQHVGEESTKFHPVGVRRSRDAAWHVCASGNRGGRVYPLLARSPILDQLSPATVAMVAQYVNRRTGERTVAGRTRADRQTRLNRSGRRPTKVETAEPSETTDLEEHHESRPTCTHDVADPGPPGAGSDDLRREGPGHRVPADRAAAAAGGRAERAGRPARRRRLRRRRARSAGRAGRRRRTGWRRAACGTTASTPRRCARRPGRRC